MNLATVPLKNNAHEIKYEDRQGRPKEWNAVIQ